MSTKAITAALALTCLTLAAFIGGSAPFGRLALTFAMPQAAHALFTDPRWQGTAKAQSGDMIEAATRFEAAGRSGFNAGTAFARAGRYAKALEVLDAHLLVFPDDQKAQENYELIRTYYAGTKIDPDSEILRKKDRDGDTIEAEVGLGSARAASTGTQSNNRTSSVDMPTLMGRGREGVRQVFDDHFYEANRKWLKSLPDLPGEYLAARIKHEHKARLANGTGQPKSAEPQ